MELQELRKKTVEELNTLRTEWVQQLERYRFQVANLQLKEVRKIRALRKQIARVLTVLQEKTHNPV